MARYIDADRLSGSLTKVIKQLTDKGVSCTDLRLFKLAIDEEPTADVAPVEHERWIKNDNGTYSCSGCHSWIPNEQHYYARYCLYCGARCDL